MAQEPSVPFLLSEDDQWLVRSVLRHEMAQQETWKFPPASLDLNHEIAMLIAAGGDGTIALTERDARILDYLVPQDAKSKDGVPIGKDLLRRVCQARRDLVFMDFVPDGELAATEPLTETKAEVLELLKELP